LKLSGESTVEKLTLDGVKGLRVALGATVHDVLYYMSPIYCQHIIDSVICYITAVPSVCFFGGKSLISFRGFRIKSD
jgi:hypothetical protein